MNNLRITWNVLKSRKQKNHPEYLKMPKENHLLTLWNLIWFLVFGLFYMRLLLPLAAKTEWRNWAFHLRIKSSALDNSWGCATRYLSLWVNNNKQFHWFSNKSNCFISQRILRKSMLWLSNCNNDINNQYGVWLLIDYWLLHLQM